MKKTNKDGSLTITIPAGTVSRCGKLLDYFSIPRSAMAEMMKRDISGSEYNTREGYFESLYTYRSRDAAKAAARKTWQAGDWCGRTMAYRNASGEEVEETFNRPGRPPEAMRKARACLAALRLGKAVAA